MTRQAFLGSALSALLGGAMLVAASTMAATADGVVAICGNTCVGEEDNGDPLCHWAPASSGQACQAKGICSADTCTLWWTAQIPAADALKISPAQAKRLPGARVTKGPRPPGELLPGLRSRLEVRK